MKKYFLILLTSIISTMHMFGAQKLESPLKVVVTLAHSHDKFLTRTLLNENEPLLELFNLISQNNNYCCVKSATYKQERETHTWPMQGMEYAAFLDVPTAILSQSKQLQDQRFPSLFPREKAIDALRNKTAIHTFYKENIPVIITVEDPEDASGVVRRQKIRYYIVSGTGILLLVAFLAYFCNRK